MATMFQSAKPQNQDDNRAQLSRELESFARVLRGAVHDIGSLSQSLQQDVQHVGSLGN